MIKEYLNKRKYGKKLKTTLLNEYNSLLQANKQLSPNKKVAVVALTKSAEWPSFIEMLDNFKYMLTARCIQTGTGKEDLLTLQAQCRTIAVLKTFQNQYKANHTKPDIENTEDPLTVPI